MSNYSILTKTFAGDMEMFLGLCKSIDEHMPHVKHHVLVDQSDLLLFKKFEKKNRIVHNSDSLFPEFHGFSVLGRRFWWRAPWYLVRGWIFQQLVKLKFAATLNSECVVMADSDAIFLRAIEQRDLFLGDSPRMYAYPGRGGSAELSKWHDVAARAFGIEAVGYGGFDYILPVLVWHPATVARMLASIDEANSSGWVKTLIGNYRFSEFILYGVYNDRVISEAERMIARSPRELCHCSWHYDLDEEDDIGRFVSDLKAEHAAIVVQSNLRLDPAKRSAIVKRLFDRYTSLEN